MTDGSPWASGRMPECSPRPGAAGPRRAGGPGLRLTIAAVLQPGGLQRRTGDARSHRCSRRGNLGRIHDRRRQAGLVCRSDDEPAEAGKAALLVRAVTGDPLHRQHVPGPGPPNAGGTRGSGEAGPEVHFLVEPGSPMSLAAWPSNRSSAHRPEVEGSLIDDPLRWRPVEFAHGRSRDARWSSYSTGGSRTNGAATSGIETPPTLNEARCPLGSSRLHGFSTSASP